VPEDLLSIDTEYGQPSIERKTLAPWFTIARLVEVELVRRRKLKGWQKWRPLGGGSSGLPARQSWTPELARPRKIDQRSSEVVLLCNMFRRLAMSGFPYSKVAELQDQEFVTQWTKLAARQVDWLHKDCTKICTQCGL